MTMNAAESGNATSLDTITRKASATRRRGQGAETAKRLITRNNFVEMFTGSPCTLHGTAALTRTRIKNVRPPLPPLVV
eukprot:9108350-Pyramimonas_sp.AAC.1